MLTVRQFSPGPKQAVQAYKLPWGSKILGFYQNGLNSPAVYYLCDPSVTGMVERHFVVMGEMWQLDGFTVQDILKFEHLGTCKDFRGGVWHCFEVEI